MRKNLNKFVLTGVIFSVFLGITGYSVGMTYGNQVSKSNEVSLRKNENRTSDGMEASDLESSSQPKTEMKSEESTDKNTEKSPKKESTSKNNSSSRGKTYSSGRTGGSYRSTNSGSRSSSPSLSASSVSIPNKLKDGTYYGSGEGYGGNLKVKVKVSGGKISDISVLSHSETPGYYEKGAAVIGKILSSQSAGVNVVSGATYTSNGIKSAVADALKGAGLSSSQASKVASAGVDSKLKIENEKLKKEIEKLKAQASNQISESNLSNLKDGTYEGEGKGFKDNVRVSVSVKNGKIEDINILGHGDDEAYFNKAINLISDIKSKQTLKVDSVSGATYSSIGIKTAVSNALKKAGMNTGDGSVSDEALKAKDKEIEKLKAKNKKLSEEIKEAKEAQVAKTAQIDTSSLRDGTYKGEGNGFRGKVKVSVTVKSGKITNISVLENSDDQPYFKNATGLIDSIINTQNVNVDSVSGATYSSLGIKQAIANAISQAGSPGSNQSAQAGGSNTPTAENPKEGAKDDKDEQISKLKERVRNYRRETKDLRDQLINASQDIKDSPLRDGIYEGEGGGFRGKVKVQVTVSAGRVSGIEVIESVDDEPYFNRAKELIGSVISSQRVKVDSVSGATYSSLGIKQAISNALSQARNSSSTTSSQPSTSSSNTSSQTGSSGSNASLNSGSSNSSSSKSSANDDKDEQIRKLKERVRNYRRETKELRDQLINSSQDINDGPLRDGTYEGEGGGFRGKVKVQVTINSGMLSAINVTESVDDTPYFNKAKELIDNVISKQRVKVDSISGATYSSLGIKQGIMDAIKKSREAN